MYTKAPAVVAAPIYDWSGFYIGVDGGGGWARKCWDATSIGGGGIVTVITPAVHEGCSTASGGMVEIPVETEVMRAYDAPASDIEPAGDRQ